MGVTPKGDFFGVILGILIAAVVSFIVTAALFGFGKGSDDAEGLTDIDLTKAEEESAARKAQGKVG
jgi:PTS system mannitol-specific IIC component